jgi:hypothetical protein
MLCWTIDNYLNLIWMFFAVIGGIFTLYQWNSAQKLRRAERLDKILDQIRTNKEISNAMYFIQNKKNWYSDSFHAEIESSIDTLLLFIDYICYSDKYRNITKKEFSILQYIVEISCRSEDVKAYLWNMYHHVEKDKRVYPFPFLLEYCQKNNFLKTDFFSNSVDCYKKVLEF